MSFEQLLAVAKNQKPTDSLKRKTIWAATLSAYFGTLRSANITTPDQRTFDPTKHLAVKNRLVGRDKYGRKKDPD